MNFAPLYGAIAAAAAIRRTSEERRKYEEGFASRRHQAIERFEQLEDEAGQSVDELRTKQQDIEARLNEIFPPIKTDNQQHPITPPPELVQQWSVASPIQSNDENWAYELFIAHRAAQWGADQELEACTAWLRDRGSSYALALYTARRPKPPSLKELALQKLAWLEDESSGDHAAFDTIRRALEQLND